MRYRFIAPALAAFAIVAGSGQAFTDDEFNSGSLDPQWTFVESAAAGSTYTMTGSEFQIDSPSTTDFFVFVDNYASIETTAPLGEDWEVVARVANWDPTVIGQQRGFSRAGLAVWQDANHYVTVGQLTDFEGDQIGIQSFSNFNPVPAPNNNGVYESVTDIGNTGPQGSYQLRIQKTGNRYRAAYSIDEGSTWVNAAAIIKTETPDGYFTDEKIRLFHVGGPFGDDPDPTTPANFDWVHVNTLTPPPPAVPYADAEFTGPALGPQWTYFEGIFPGFTFFGTTPAQTGKFIMTGGNFADLWINKENATYIYQNAPASTSYTVTMKGGPVEFTAVGYELFNCYGIWLWHDSSSWAFLCNQRGEQGGVPNNRYEYAVKSNGIFYAGNFSFGTTTADLCPEYLRIQRQNADVSLQYSFDNVNWTTVVHDPSGLNLSSFQIGTDDLEVRLFTKRAFADGAPMEAEFDWLHADIEPGSDVNDWQLY